MDSGFERDIREFKTASCDETHLIAETLRRKFSDFVRDPILDVGAGFQGIAVEAFPGHEIIMLDKIAYGQTSTRGRCVTGDFLEYDPAEQDRPQTILFCHVLQYLDDDLDSLFRKIKALNPRRIIIVVNDNDSEFGDTVRWAKRHLPSSNPEENVSMERIGYHLARTSRLQATLACHDFDALAYQFGRMILDLSEDASRTPALRAHLQSLLDRPTMKINQTIYGYEK